MNERFPRATIASATAAAACVALACGSSPPPPAVDDAPKETIHEVKPALRTSSELGTVDPAAVQQVFHRLDDRFLDCQKQGIDRVEVLAGNAKFFLRIGPDGSAKWAFLEAGSDIGDRDTEKCLLSAVMGARWPRPVGGGDAEARYSTELLSQGRAASDWSPDKVAAVLGKNGDAIDRCKEGGSGFRATMYVGPGGKVLSVGVVTSTKDGDDRAECLAKVLGQLKGLPSPGSWPAKVTFGL
jgi:hypothetical protein